MKTRAKFVNANNILTNKKHCERHPLGPKHTSCPPSCKAAETCGHHIASTRFHVRVSSGSPERFRLGAGSCHMRRNV